MILKAANKKDAEEEFLFIRNIPCDENGYINTNYQIKREDFDDALDIIIANSEGRRLPEGYVPATTYYLWDNGIIIGEFQLRHHLCESLVNGSGHIGYYIAPQFRGKGCATAGLKLLLEEARRTVPEKEIYLHVFKSNPASLKVMLKNGGYIHHETDDGYFVRIKK